MKQTKSLAYWRELNRLLALVGKSPVSKYWAERGIAAGFPPSDAALILACTGASK